jgi:hypothetical protein
MRVVADLLAYEEAHNPAGGVEESDPYGILRRGDSSIVTDAGANDLLKVTDRGRVSTLAVFPSRMVDFQGGEVPMDAVPTTVVRGPDGAYYVGQLTGFPFPLHGARVFRVVPGEKPTVWARGFTNIIDMAFRNGKLYVLEIAHNSLATSATPFGALLRLNPDGFEDGAVQGPVLPHEPRVHLGRRRARDELRDLPRRRRGAPDRALGTPHDGKQTAPTAAVVRRDRLARAPRDGPSHRRAKGTVVAAPRQLGRLAAHDDRPAQWRTQDGHRRLLRGRIQPGHDGHERLRHR